MKLTDAELKKLMNQAARSVGHRRPHWLDADDLKQIATLAYLEAQQRGNEGPVEDRRHLENYTRRRAVWAMLDAMRATFSQVPPDSVSLDLEDEDGETVHRIHAVAPDNPERTYQLRQALMVMDRRATPQWRAAAPLLGAEVPANEVAETLGVSESRVSKLRSAAWRELAPCL